MAVHYSQPGGFVGRSICYLVWCMGRPFGAIVGGSATLHLPNRDAFFGIGRDALQSVVNNVFFHVEPKHGRYPCRNFTDQVLHLFEKRITVDWSAKYGTRLAGMETLVEPPRTGEVYRRAGWTLIGKTIGYTCKRGPGKGSDRWGGKRVWDTGNRRPKLVFAKKIVWH